MADNGKKVTIPMGFSPSDPKEVVKFQDELIQKSEVSRARGFAFERRQRLPYLIQKGLAKPGTISYDILRRASISVHVARICVNVLKEKITKTDWTIKPIDPLQKTDEGKIKRVEALFKKPNNNSETFRSLLDKILEDLLVLDAVAIEKTRFDNGELAELHHVDAATIRPVYDEHGNQDVIVPLLGADGKSRELPVSYVQVLDANPYGGREAGQLVGAWPKKDFIYFHMHPQGNMGSFGFGLSPLESVIGVVSGILNADNFNGTYFEEGSFPPMIIQLKQNMDVRELQAMREYLYNELEGRFHRPAIFGGEGDIEIKSLKDISQRDMQFMDYMKFMANLLAAAYGLSGQDIGLTEDIGSKNVAETQKDLSQAKGYGSILHLLKEIFNREILWNDFGFTDLEFDWVAPDTTDPKTLADTVDIRLKNGTMTINEARQVQGEEPYGEWADIPMIQTANGYTAIVAPEEEETVPNKNQVENNPVVSDSKEESDVHVAKSIQSTDGVYEVYVDDRGVSQPFIFYNVITGDGRVIKPPVAVNLDSQKLEEEWTHKLFKEEHRVVPVSRVSERDIFDKVLTTSELKTEFNKYQIMSSEYDSKKWSTKYGRSRKYPYYIVSKYVEGRNLKDQLLIEDMKRVPGDYEGAIKDLVDLWKMEKTYVLGDRRADQYLITPDKRAWGFDYQFVGNKVRYDGTKNAISKALEQVPDLQKLFIAGISGETLKSRIMKRLRIRKEDLQPISVRFATFPNSEKKPLLFGELLTGPIFKEKVVELFSKQSISLLLKAGFKENSFFYNFEAAVKSLKTIIDKNPKACGGIITQEDIGGVKYFVYVKE